MDTPELEHPRLIGSGLGGDPDRRRGAAHHSFGASMSEADGVTERVIADQQQLYRALVGRYLSNADDGRHEDNDSLVDELRRWQRRQREQQ